MMWSEADKNAIRRMYAFKFMDELCASLKYRKFLKITNGQLIGINVGDAFKAKRKLSLDAWFELYGKPLKRKLQRALRQITIAGFAELEYRSGDIIVISPDTNVCIRIRENRLGLQVA